MYVTKVSKKNIRSEVAVKYLKFNLRSEDESSRENWSITINVTEKLRKTEKYLSLDKQRDIRYNRKPN
jgi:hypothetical protein